MQPSKVITKISELKRVISDVIKGKMDDILPVVLTYHEGMEFSKYKITIEAMEEEFFVDAKGKKWQRVHDND